MKHGVDESVQPVTSRENRELAVTAFRAQQWFDCEHALRPLEAVKAYPMAVFWSLMVSCTIIMEGYDTVLIGNFFAYPAFAEKYGQFIDANGHHQLSASWQAGLGSCANMGALLGALLNGVLVDRFGQKRIILGALGKFFADFLCGVFTSSAPVYASEVLPLSLRPFMTSYSNMCFIIGQLIAAGVLAGLVHRTDEWAFRIPFAVQWVWPAVLIPVLCFAPESPWYLVRKGRHEKAAVSLLRLQSQDKDIDTEATLAAIRHTNELEKHFKAGTRYRDCFRPIERRRTEIACMAFVASILSGASFANNSTYFFQQVGLDSDTTYKLNIGGTALALVATLVNWFALMPFFGRRRIFLCGLLTMTSILFTIGLLNVWRTSKGVGMTQAVLTLVWTFVFQASVSQLGWTIPAEIGSTRLKQKTMCLVRDSYQVATIISNVLQSYFMNPDEWNLRGYTGFFWGSTALLTFVWAFFRLPETKDRSYEELTWLFVKGTPARAFAKTRVSVFEDEAVENVAGQAT